MEDGLQLVVLLSTTVIAQIKQALDMLLVCVTISPTLQFYWYVLYFTIQCLYPYACVPHSMKMRINNFGSYYMFINFSGRLS